ncbi:MAG: hypothetical protein PHW78_09590 [Macromonas bipunctata]|nr:hypothetical protein [Macromonas bipunctata]
MKPFIRDTLERQRLRLHELDALLSAPDATGDMERFRQLTREHADTDAVVQPYLRISIITTFQLQNRTSTVSR